MFHACIAFGVLDELQAGQGVVTCGKVGGKAGPDDGNEKRAESLVVARHSSVVLHAAEELGERYGDGLLRGGVPAVGVQDQVGVRAWLCTDVVDEGIGDEMGFVGKFGGFGELDEMVWVGRVWGGVVGVFAKEGRQMGGGGG